MTESNSFAEMITSERARLTQRRSDLTTSIAQLNRHVADADREFAALAAYEGAKTGKPPTKVGNATVGIRARKGSRRKELVDLVTEHAAPMTRGDMIDALGAKGNKSAEMSISNALTALTKTGMLARAGGKYILPATQH